MVISYRSLNTLILKFLININMQFMIGNLSGRIMAEVIQFVIVTPACLLYTARKRNSLTGAGVSLDILVVSVCRAYQKRITETAVLIRLAPKAEPAFRCVKTLRI